MAVLLVLMGLFCWGYGLALIFAKDAAWRYTEWSNSLRGLVSDRTDSWDAYATWRGVALLVVGSVFLCFLRTAAPSSLQPAVNGYSSLTIEGRQATPEQQQEFEQEINAQRPNGQPANVPPSGAGGS